MYKRLIWLILVFISILNGKPIDEKLAEKKAIAWINIRNNGNFSIKKELFSSGIVEGDKNVTKHKYKIVELEPRGWAIISLDDVIEPIIGYGESKIDSKKLPPALVEYLNSVDNTIEYLNKHPELVKKNEKRKLLYGADDYGYVVRPLLWLGSSSDTEEQGIRWNQGRYYNALTPVDENGNHTWVGCVATAMGQLMRYWKYPSVGVGEHCYTPYSHPEYGEQCADFGSTNYDWENMPLTLTSDNYAVAQALYHAGVAVDMNYAPEGSGAWMGDSLKKYFNYRLSVGVSLSRISSSEWNSILKNELNNARPIMYSGSTDNGGGHQFIIDGYDTDGYYHINWGWGGHYNGKFTLNNMNYKNYQYAYIIAPSDPSRVISIPDKNFESCIINSLSLKDKSEIRELSIKFAESLYCGHKNINSIKGIEYFKYITSLDLWDNNIIGTLDFSNYNKLDILVLGYNNIDKLILPKNSISIWYVNISGNSKLNVLTIANLKNIVELYAYDTKKIYCWQKKALMKRNNITNLYLSSCISTTSDTLDTDRDGINNLNDPDDDNDGINDLDDEDIDGDGISNIDEKIWGFDPMNPKDGGNTDTDGDGVSNVDEILAGSNPLDPKDTKKPKKFIPVSIDDIVIILPVNN